MGDFFSAVLGAEFHKIAGIGGLCFIVLGVIPGQIVLGPIKLSQRDKIGRILSISLGLIFAMFPVTGAVFNSTIGVASPTVTNSVKPGIEEPVGSLLVSPAYAQAGSYTITVIQRSWVDTTSVFNGVTSKLYVGDIHLSDPNVVAIFRADAPGADQIVSGADFDEATIRSIIPDGVFFAGYLKQGEQREFVVEGVSHTLSVDTVLWNLIGDDSMVFSVR